MKKLSPQQETLRLLREIRAEIWILNADERMKGLQSRLDYIQGNEEAVQQRLEAMERYFGVKFNPQPQYEKKRIQKKGNCANEAREAEKDQ